MGCLYSILAQAGPSGRDYLEEQVEELKAQIKAEKQRATDKVLLPRSIFSPYVILVGIDG